MNQLLEAPARALRSPVRNRYFWGKLLDAEHLDLEQRYHNEKRWLLNRQAHGTGVLCGLAVEPADGQRLWIRPGVALDGRGREVVVPESFCLEHPDQPTDDLGAPVGDLVRDATVWICLAYHECDIEPVRAFTDCCDPSDGCRANAVRERFRVLVHKDPPPAPETVFDGVDPGALNGHGPALVGPARVAAGPGGDGVEKTLLGLRRRLCEAWRSTCGPAALECVPIAQAVVDGNGAVKPQPCGLRRQIPSNADLLDGLLLAAYLFSTRVNALETAAGQRQRLRYQGGDSQSAKAGQSLTVPISVLAEDTDGNPLANTDVHFHVMGGGGSVGLGGDDQAATTGADGVAAIAWTLGPTPGLNSVEALLGDARIAFQALAV